MKNFFLLVIFFIKINFFSQVNFNGGFEDTPVGTGWTIINGSATNKWFVGTNQKKSGTYGAYIGTASNNNAYSTTAISTVHMYKEITFPPCTGDATLSFYLKVNGEKVGTVLYDWLVTRLTPTTITMAASTTNQTSGQVANCSIYNPSYVVSQTACNHSNEAPGMYFQKTSWSLITITIPQSLAGYTAGASSVRRLWFTWSNDDAGGSAVGAAIDDILIKTACDLILPTQLTKFKAERIKEHVILIWETASEINNDYFALERSLDGTNFHTIDVIKGKGNTYQSVTYQSTDNEPGSDITYYRLKQVDLNGKYTYSKIVAVEASDKEIYISQPVPNPFNDEFSISFQLKNKIEFITEIYDLSGKKVRIDYDIFEPGTSHKFCQLKDYENGIYFFNIKSLDGSSNFNYKLIKN